jgi:hypothetical protein
MQTRLGDVIGHLKVVPERPDDDVIDNDLILVWGSERRITPDPTCWAAYCEALPPSKHETFNNNGEYDKSDVCSGRHGIESSAGFWSRATATLSATVTNNHLA